MAALTSIKRKHIRFAASEDSLLEIGSTDQKVGKFTVRKYGFPINESFSGCCFATRADHDLEPDQIIWLRLDREMVIKAQVVWVKKVDDEVHKIGVQYYD